MVYFSQNCDIWGQTSPFHIQSHFLPFISLINFDGLRFPRRKHFLNADYPDQLKAGEGGVHWKSL